MGAWDKLDTELTAEVDTTDLNMLIELGEDYFSPIQTWAEEVKLAIEEGTRAGLKQLADWNRSWQQQAIQDNCKNPSGILSSSIEAEGGDLYFLIGTTINHIYPLCVEFGRGEVHPIPPRTRLRYYGEDGYLIYPRMAGKADPVPFVAPAYERTSDVAEQTMITEIGKKLPKK